MEVVYVTKEVKLPKETSEVADRFVDLARAVKEAAKDGFGVDDIPSIIASAVGAIGELSDFTAIQNEIATDPEAAAKVAADLASGLLGVLAAD